MSDQKTLAFRDQGEMEHAQKLMLSMLDHVLPYLEHPDVIAMAFCYPVQTIAERVREAAATARAAGINYSPKEQHES